MHTNIKSIINDCYLRQSSENYHKFKYSLNENRLDSNLINGTPITKIAINISLTFKEDYNRKFYLHSGMLVLIRTERVYKIYSTHIFKCI